MKKIEVIRELNGLLNQASDLQDALLATVKRPPYKCSPEPLDIDAALSAIQDIYNTARHLMNELSIDVEQKRICKQMKAAK